MTTPRLPAIQWLFIVSVALFIGGIAFIIAAAREARPKAAARVELPPTTPVASIKQIMNGIVLPNANVIYDAVGTVIDAAGVHETAPKNDKEWATVADSAAAIVESGNLMLLGNRAIDKGEWVRLTRKFADAGKAVLVAAEAKQKEGVFAAGGELDETCDGCHEKYQRQ
jgi:hypothetical protein